MRALATRRVLNLEETQASNLLVDKLLMGHEKRWTPCKMVSAHVKRH
jgi:hypothetical protein